MRGKSGAPESKAMIAAGVQAAAVGAGRCRRGDDSDPPPERRGRRRLPVAAAVVGAVLLSSGCTGGSDSDASASESPSATDSPSPTPTPSVTPPYPTGADGCHDNSGWTSDEVRTWLQIQARASDVETSKDVAVGPVQEGFDGPLCEPVTVQVEFWKLTYGSPSEKEKSDPGTPDFYFAMERAKRTRLRTDGSGEQQVTAPKKLYADDRSVCVGALVTVTAGKPLSEKELPESIKLSDAAYGNNDTVEFRTERVAVYELTRPKAAHVCNPEGKPTADPDKVPAPTAEPEPTSDPYGYDPLPLPTLDPATPTMSFG
ncbi:hypothetical protein SGFS_013740 [Streptomyces graminofaciens]|uniref:Lipoprotein n=1 Tax=Streptomyces graminofaciens TaxID=68212 RepID=A0ABM7F2R4_9ACTN|nr:hypothetical protein [Streptomyces graminofaciens]BBC30080.1 hypothetical protein SGFS_013740 [Streptomyces graminofaciens]